MIGSFKGNIRIPIRILKGETALDAKKRIVDEFYESRGLPKPASYSSIVTDDNVRQEPCTKLVVESQVGTSITVRPEWNFE